VVAGDPCFDRILASVPFRRRYRTALGVGDRQLVFVSSTWSAKSALGARFELLRELLAELPRDSYAVATALHPNISHRHGSDQVMHWYADCLRAGLIVLPEIDGWRAGVIAADVAIGDSGSVTGYCAAIGTPTLLAEFPNVPDGTAISELGRAARLLPSSGPYLPHIEAAISEAPVNNFNGVAELVTSEPERALSLLRGLFYSVLEIPEPPVEVAVPAVPTPSIPPPPSPFADTVVARIDRDANTIHLARCPAEVARGHRNDLPEQDVRFLCCSADYPIRALWQKAAVLVATAADLEDPSGWMRKTLRHNPFCVAVMAGDEDHGTILFQTGESIELQGAPASLLAVAAHAWLLGSRSRTLTHPIRVTAGTLHYDIHPCDRAYH
jgi:hypothetical protein